jgi:hypothetical protein
MTGGIGKLCDDEDGANLMMKIRNAKQKSPQNARRPCSVVCPKFETISRQGRLVYE